MYRFRNPGERGEQDNGSLCWIAVGELEIGVMGNRMAMVKLTEKPRGMVMEGR
jgi:hypothetical protein